MLVCENNGYAEFSPLSAHTKVERLARHAETYGIPAVTVDGNDVLAVRAAARRGRRARTAGGGPTFVEALTYRLRGHYEGDPGKYRELSELADWRRRTRSRRFSCALGRGRAEADDRTSRMPDPGARPGRRSTPRPTPALAAPCPGRRTELLTHVHGGGGLMPRAAVHRRHPLRARRGARARPARSCLLGEDVTRGRAVRGDQGPRGHVRRRRGSGTRPISEATVMGLAVGAALAGRRPVVEIMFVDFITLAMDQLVNHAREAALHERRTAVRAAGRPRPGRRAAGAMARAPQPEPGGVAHPRARPAGRGAVHARGRPRRCSAPPSATTTRSSYLEHRGAVLDQRGDVPAGRGCRARAAGSRGRPPARHAT